MIYLQPSMFLICYGVGTVESSSIRKEAQFDGKLEYGVESTSLVERNVFNKDEIMRMDNDEEVIYIRGFQAFKCKKLRFWNYRLGKNIKEESIEDYKPINKPKLESVEEKIEQNKLPTFEEFLRQNKRNL